MVGLKTQLNEGLGHCSNLLIVLLVSGVLPLTPSLDTHGMGVRVPGKDQNINRWKNTYK